MKKILLSLGAIVAVGALVAGATVAFYNDSETSRGNVFTAGSVDLTVDQTRASYNGEECETCHLEIVSDDTTYVGVNPAEILTFLHEAWTADLDGEHVVGMPNDGADDGSKWIWIDSEGPTQPQLNQTYTFERIFEWNGEASSATLYLATDNLYTDVNLNGNFIASTADDNNFTAETEDVFSNLEGSLIQGENVLQVTVRNVGVNGGTPTGNPAGLLFKLEIEGACGEGNAYQNTPGATCELWGPQDLDGEQYFDFGDVKPGDYGTNLISLHVDDNDSYACLIPHDLQDNENDVVEPETGAGDPGTPNGLDGELSQFVEFFLWADNGDGAYQDTEEVLAGPGTTIDQIQTEMAALELVGGGPVTYVGLAWCAGDQTVDGSNVECDGAGMSDIAQTDSLFASLTAYAEQTRNNPDFSCENVSLELED